MKARTMTAWIKRVGALVPLLAVLWGVTSPAHAELQIEITSGVRDPIPIAVVPFTRVPTDGGVDVSEVVQRDLAGSGRFKTFPRTQMTSTPTRGQDVVAAEWKAGGNDYVVVGRVSGMSDGQLAVDFDRSQLLAVIANGTSVRLTLYGRVRGVAFQATDTIRVRD